MLGGDFIVHLSMDYMMEHGGPNSNKIRYRKIIPRLRWYL